MVARPHDDALARSLGVIALVLFVLFVTGLVGVLFPLRLLNSAWQLRMISGLISAALTPLLGLVLLRLAIALDPSDTRLLSQWRLCSGLAVAASLGFLLLLPLHIQAGWRQSQTLRQAQINKVERAEAQLARLRQAVSMADSQMALNQALQQLSGPTLSSSDLAKPLPLLKSQVQQAFAQAEQEIRQVRQQRSAPTGWRALPERIRIGVASLALGVGFASLAQRPGARLSLLGEWMKIPELLQPKRLFRQLVRPHSFSRQDYIRQLSGAPPAGPISWLQKLRIEIESQRRRARYRRLARQRQKQKAAMRRLMRVTRSRSRPWRQALAEHLDALRRRSGPGGHHR